MQDGGVMTGDSQPEFRVRLLRGLASVTDQMDSSILLLDLVGQPLSKRSAAVAEALGISEHELWRRRLRAGRAAARAAGPEHDSLGWDELRELAGLEADWAPPMGARLEVLDEMLDRELAAEQDDGALARPARERTLEAP